MGTLMDKLNATNDAKEQIRQAIERKKVSVPTSTPLKQYPEKIDAIYPDAIFMQENNFGDGCTTKLPNGDTVTQWAQKVVYGNNIYIGYNLSSTNTDYSSVNNAFLVKSSNESDWVRVANGQVKEVVFFKGVFICMYASTYSGVKWSADGKTWNSCTFSGGTNYVGGFFFTDNNYLYLVKSDGSTTYLYKSSDGKSFAKVDTSSYPTSSYPITSMLYSDKFKKYYMCKSQYSGGAPRYKHYYSSDLKNWTSIEDDLDGDFRLVGERLYCNYFRNKSSIVELWSYYTNDGVTWNGVNLSSSDTDINVFSYVNGTYFAFSYNSSTKYEIYYSENGMDNWKEMELPINLKFEPNWSVCNGIVFNMTLQSTNAEYVVFTKNYSFDGFTWFNEIHSMFVDVNDNNVTSKVVNNFANKYSQDMLNTAYNAGVNSI